MLSKSLPKRCLAFCALPSQIHSSQFTSVCPTSKLRKVTETSLIAVLSSAFVYTGGVSYSADLPTDGNLGTTAYKDSSYTITDDLQSTITVGMNTIKNPVFSSATTAQEIQSTKNSLTISAMGGAGIFFATVNKQTIDIPDADQLSSQTGRVFVVSYDKLVSATDPDAVASAVTQRITGNFKTLKADISGRAAIVQFGLGVGAFQPGALISNNGGVQILGVSQEEAGGQIDKMIMNTTRTSSAYSTERGVAISNRAPGFGWLGDQQIYMPINQIGEEDNRFGAGVANVYGSNQYIQKIGTIYATNYGIANGSASETADCGPQVIREVDTIDINNATGLTGSHSIGIYNYSDNGACTGDGGECSKSSEDSQVHHIGTQYVGITNGVRTVNASTTAGSLGIYNIGGVSTIEAKNPDQPVWIDATGPVSRSIYISPVGGGFLTFDTATHMRGSFDLRSGNIVVANDKHEKALSADLTFNTTALPNSDTLTLGPDVNIQILRGKYADASPRTSLSFGDKLDPLSSGYKVRLGRKSYINDKGAFSGNSTLYFGTNWQKQSYEDAETGATVEKDVLKVNTNGIILNNVQKQSSGDPTRLNLTVTVDTNNLPDTLGGSDGYSGTDNPALLNYLNTGLNALQLMREAANNVVIGDEESRQNIAPADGYFENRYGSSETGLKIKEENFYPVLRLDSEGKAVGIYVGKQVEDKLEHYTPEGADWKYVGIEKGDGQTITSGEWQKIKDGDALTLASYKDYLSKGYTIEAYLNGKPLSEKEIEWHLLKQTENHWKDESRDVSVLILYPDAKHRYEKEHWLKTTGWIAANEDNLHNPFNLNQKYEILPSNRKIAGYVELSIPEGLVTPEATYVAPYYFEDIRAVGNPNNITDSLVDGNPRVEELYPETNTGADPDNNAEGSGSTSSTSPNGLKYMGQVFGIVEAPITDKKIDPYVKYDPLQLYETGDNSTENRLTVNFTDCDDKCDKPCDKDPVPGEDNPGVNNPVIDHEVHNPTVDPDTGFIVPGEGSTSTMDALSSISMTNYFLWRQENETLYQRMGEIRDRTDLEGAWVRVLGGKNTYDSGNTYFKNRYHGFQIGFDHVADKENNGKWIFGAALGYTRGSSDYSNDGSGKNWIGSLSAYAVKKFDNGAYLDLILKGSRLSNDFTAISKLNRYISKGKYHTNALQASIEAGHKIPLSETWYVDPQLQLTYGYIKDAKYRTDTRINVHVKGTPSTIGRAGISLGREAKEGSAFVKLDVLREFTSKYKATYTLDNGARNKNSVSMKDTWGEISVGGTYNFNKDTYGFAQIKRSFGAKIQQDYRADIGMRYVF
ncbi:autotransporter outer membrane beta-barrel domain-containing protein [uncultured Parasutterella sp.]|uniref:autotransporter outer membrane beta-barrel domain-containing protein n=3 Tax=uncultured Parasutterella sp. TaxID=1263098 RepID=UPI0025B64B04|nr:autotransporter outer membrane beta-barrel domain-containing protein [uncultured Parasutterella sp.]